MLTVWPFGDNHWGGCCLDPKKSRREIFQRIFALGIFWGGVSRYAATPVIVALSPGHSDITRFRPWSQIATGNCLDRAEKKSKSCSDEWHHWCFWFLFRHFRTHCAESLRTSKSSGIMDPTHSREMPNCSAIDLAEIWQSSKISSWIWSIISGVVSVLGCPGWGTSQVEKSPRSNWATHFLTVAYDGACSPNVSIRMAWISFDALSCRKKKNLMTAHVSTLLKSRASPYMLPFSLWNKKRLAIRHMNRHLFLTTLSILSYIRK